MANLCKYCRINKTHTDLCQGCFIALGKRLPFFRRIPMRSSSAGHDPRRTRPRAEVLGADVRSLALLAGQLVRGE